LWIDSFSAMREDRLRRLVLDFWAPTKPKERPTADNVDSTTGETTATSKNSPNKRLCFLTLFVTNGSFGFY
jgi:hypothetical protein